MHTANGSIYFLGPVLVVQGYPDAHDLHTDLHTFFTHRRPVKTNALGRKYPETTTDDVRQVVALFDVRAKHADMSVKSVRDAVTAWRAYATAVNTVLKLSPLSGRATFSDNDRLWTHETRRLAKWLSAERATRPEEKTITGSLVDSAKALPGRVVGTVTGSDDAADKVTTVVGDAAGAIVDAAETVIDKATGAVKSVAKLADEHLPKLPKIPDPFGWAEKMAREFKWPLIIGASVLGGLVILPHLTDKQGPR